MAEPTSSPRPRTSRGGVRFADGFARVFITVGGLGVIAAVLAIMVYLVREAWPLFGSGSAVQQAQSMVPAPQRPVRLLIDEYAGRVAIIGAQGQVSVIDPVKGRILATRQLAGSETAVSAVSYPEGSGAVAVGFGDGRVAVGTVRFASEVLTGDELPAGLPADAAPGDRRDLPEGDYVELTPERQWRRSALSIEMNEAVALPAGTGAVTMLDYRTGSSSQFLAALREDGTAVFNTVRVTRPLGGGKPRASLSSEPIEFRPPEGTGRPMRLLLTGDGAHVLALWPDGLCQRYARADGAEKFTLAESARLAPQGRTVTAADFLIGSQTLMLGLDDGAVLGVFVARANSLATFDGRTLAIAHRFAGGGKATTALATGLRDRSFIAGDAAGVLSVLHMTSQKEIASVRFSSGAGVVLAAIGPKNDSFAAVTADGAFGVWRLDPKHPEASAMALFGRVWYEGDAAPSWVYQSSAGEDTAETKISLTPLIFGTLKATVYSMLFAVPIAIFAAIYTSELLHPRVRSKVKPAIEMMASLPSVVLGFVAAMVIAPIARDILPSILVAFGVVPVVMLTGAHLWQLLPVRISSRITSAQHLGLVLILALAGLGISRLVGPLVERALFAPSEADVLVLAGSYEAVPRAEWPEHLRARSEVPLAEARPLRARHLYPRAGGLVRPTGSTSDPAVAEVIARDRLDAPDMRRWLDGNIGSPWPGWFLLMVPGGVIVAVLLRSRTVEPLVARLPTPGGHGAAALLELIKFGATLVVGVLLAVTFASTLTSLGLDTRDSIFGTFDQRNTLVVAIVMGFAIIPIIYTISEDSLSAVPGQLRSASLGCGATRWQTAVRVVMPIAMSGIFSACMIGLGRAAGETMIVLMATGNTPNMDWNIFAGFRTLAANIATEMPEAVVGSTHYRVLFLGALCLFALTFVVNTAAELVRQRVRRKGAGL